MENKKIYFKTRSARNTKSVDLEQVNLFMGFKIFDF